MYHTNFRSKIILSNILNQLKHIPSKALVPQYCDYNTGSTFLFNYLLYKAPRHMNGILVFYIFTTGIAYYVKEFCIMPVLGP